jgi:hypothetical protein
VTNYHAIIFSKGIIILPLICYFPSCYQTWKIFWAYSVSEQDNSFRISVSVFWSIIYFFTVLQILGWFWRSTDYNTGWTQGSDWTGFMGNWLWERTSSRSLHQHPKICTMDRQSHDITDQIMKKKKNLKPRLRQYVNICVHSAKVNFVYNLTKVCVVGPTDMCHLDRT